MLFCVRARAYLHSFRRASRVPIRFLFVRSALSSDFTSRSSLFPFVVFYVYVKIYKIYYRSEEKLRSAAFPRVSASGKGFLGNRGVYAKYQY